MADKLAYKYDTGRGFYINQYVSGTITVAFEGTVEIGRQVINSLEGLKFSVTDPKNLTRVSEYAVGLKSGSINGYEVTHSTKTEATTGETRTVTELKFEASTGASPSMIFL